MELNDKKARVFRVFLSTYSFKSQLTSFHSSPCLTPGDSHGDVQTENRLDHGNPHVRLHRGAGNHGRRPAGYPPISY